MLSKEMEDVLLTVHSKEAGRDELTVQQKGGGGEEESSGIILFPQSPSRKGLWSQAFCISHLHSRKTVAPESSFSVQGTEWPRNPRRSWAGLFFFFYEEGNPFPSRRKSQFGASVALPIQQALILVV